MKSLWRWLRGVPAEPELVEFERDPGAVDRVEVLLTVERSLCLRRSELRSLRRAGTRYWWLRHQQYGFARLDLPRGDRPVRQWLLLPRGQYMLGVGCGESSRRLPLRVGRTHNAPTVTGWSPL